MLQRMLVAALLVQGIVAGGAHAYFQDFDGLSDGDPVTDLTGWSSVDIDGNPTSAPEMSHASTEVAFSPNNSAVFSDSTAGPRIVVDLADPAVLGVAPSSGVVRINYRFYYTTNDGSVKMFVNGIGSAGDDNDTNQIFRSAPYSEPPNNASPLGSTTGGSWVSLAPIPPTPAATWNNIEYLVDLDADTVLYTFNGVSSGPHAHGPATDLGYVVFRPIADGVASFIDDVDITIVPEPVSLILLGMAAPLVLRRRR